MRPLATLLVLALFAGPLNAPVQAQVKSDYQIQQDFETEYRSILQAIRDARTVVECVEIDSRLIDLELAYREYAPMIEKAFYPDGFEGGVTKARDQLDAAKEKLNLIEGQYAQILQLESRVRTLAIEVDSLSLLNTSLLAELVGLRSQRISDKRAIDSLNALVVKLRTGMRDRDRMIFAMVDSLFLQYDKDVSAMTDAERQGIAARVERRNVFTSVRRSIDDNVRFLESTTLTGSDFKDMSSEQKQFSSKWKGLGPKLAEIYIGSRSRRAEEIASIDTMLMVWDQKLDSALWRNLNQAFLQRDVQLPGFSNGGEFLTSLHGYLDAEILSATDGRDGATYERYEMFADSLWAREMMPFWVPVLLERSLISAEDVTAIEAKLADWKSKVSPPSILTYVIVAFFLVVVLGVLYMLFRKKKPKLPPSQASPSKN